MNCDDVKFSLGVYVLGALDEDERAQVEAHLDGCPECRAELAELSGLPPMLGKVAVEDIERVAAPPRAVLERLLVASARRHRLSRVMLSLAASIVVVAVGVSVVASQTSTPETTSAAGSAADAKAAPEAGSERALGADSRLRAPEPVASEDMSVMSDTGPASKYAPETRKLYGSRGAVKLTLLLTPEAGGTKLLAHLAGVPVDTRCYLFAVSRTGPPQQVASWEVRADAYHKGVATFPGSTVLTLPEIVKFELRGPSGSRLIVVDVTP